MPKTQPTTIEELYVVIAKNPEGIEGLAMGVDITTGKTEPLLGGRRRVHRVLQLAQALANESGVELSLVKFSSRGNLQTI